MELPRVLPPSGSTDLCINSAAGAIGTPESSIASNASPQLPPAPPPTSNPPSYMSTVNSTLRSTCLSLFHAVAPRLDPEFELASPPGTPPIPRSMIAGSMEPQLRKLRAEALESGGRSENRVRGLGHAYVTARLQEWAAISGQDGESPGVMTMDEDGGRRWKMRFEEGTENEGFDDGQGNNVWVRREEEVEAV
ncbi:hypothetical protein BGX38DRAFT_1258891 [Terfezia claveryi]|nr:hypothetical protein BGX38DRAFT_1258891 [Terfezia claveryi]